MKTWTQSFSGKQIFPLALKPEMVTFEDIPHALAQKVRFSGQTRMPLYSVAQHCVEGARLLPPVFALPFLLHEVSEVYLPDIPSPVKPFVTVCGGQTWAELEAVHADVILEALGLSPLRPLLDSPQVKQMDLAMLAAEKRDLLGPSPAEWNMTVEPAAVALVPWSPECAERAFTQMYWRLRGANT